MVLGSAETEVGVLYVVDTDAMTGTGPFRLSRSAISGDAEVAPKSRAEATSANESFMFDMSVCVW